MQQGAQVELSGCFMLEEGVPLREKEGVLLQEKEGRGVDYLEGDATCLLI